MEENNSFREEHLNEEQKALLDSLEKPEKGNKFLAGVVTGLLLSLCITGIVYLVSSRSSRLELKYESTQKAEDKLLSNEVKNKLSLLEESIKTYYLNEVSNEDLEVGLYRGMVDALEDPYSEYITVDELKDLKESTEGRYYGIGAYIGFDSETNYCVITGLIENTPAEAAGLKPNDHIIEVDGKDCFNMSTSDIVLLIKGEENTDVELTIYREGESDYLHITVTRKQVEAPTVTYRMLENHIALIDIDQFEAVTSNQFEEKLAEAREDGMKALIIDLRGNPGGLLTSVVDIANQLLPAGKIVYTEDKNGQGETYTSDGKHEIDVPLVVLVNGYSASASEILAGAIKDHGVGKLIGTTTFGKGIVQKIFGITDGSAVKLTISHYYTPNGNDIHGVGIEPDEVLELDSEKYLEDGTDNQLERAVEVLTKELK